MPRSRLRNCVTHDIKVSSTQWKALFFVSECAATLRLVCSVVASVRRTTALSCGTVDAMTCQSGTFALLKCRFAHRKQPLFSP